MFGVLCICFFLQLFFCCCLFMFCCGKEFGVATLLTLLLLQSTLQLNICHLREQQASILDCVCVCACYKYHMTNSYKISLFVLLCIFFCWFYFSVLVSCSFPLGCCHWQLFSEVLRFSALVYAKFFLFFMVFTQFLFIFLLGKTISLLNIFCLIIYYYTTLK